MAYCLWTVWACLNCFKWQEISNLIKTAKNDIFNMATLAAIFKLCEHLFRELGSFIHGYSSIGHVVSQMLKQQNFTMEKQPDKRWTTRHDITSLGVQSGKATIVVWLGFDLYTTHFFLQKQEETESYLLCIS